MRIILQRVSLTPQNISWETVLPLVNARVQVGLTTHFLNCSYQTDKDLKGIKLNWDKKELSVKRPYFVDGQEAQAYVSQLNLSPVDVIDKKRHGEQLLLIPFHRNIPYFLEHFVKEAQFRSSIRGIKHRGHETFQKETTSCFSALYRKCLIKNSSSCFIIDEPEYSQERGSEGNVIGYKNSTDVHLVNCKNVVVIGSSNIRLNNCSNLIIYDCKDLSLINTNDSAYFGNEIKEFEKEEGITGHETLYEAYNFEVIEPKKTKGQELAERLGLKDASQLGKAFTVALQVDPDTLYMLVTGKGEDIGGGRKRIIKELTLADLNKIIAKGMKAHEEKKKKKR